MAPKRNARDTPTSSSTTITTTIPNAPSSNKTPSSSLSSKANQQNRSPQEIALGIWQNYLDTTPQRTKLIDVFMAFLAVVGVLQFVYCIVAGNYPFNAFLSGFSASVGQFVLTASLRVQTIAENNGEYSSVSPERAFADYVFGSLILHFFCVNFIN